ncbi:DUF2690 domain-containing protein [Kitasatospora sp. NPDC058162]|uniref:DUF2690 domain-containing protein n=1 Tax=Kitasatospora sp. NPDC058162 TaxID=3346362 RepID=UPI0036DA36C7
MRSLTRKAATAGATLVLAMSGALLAAGPASAATSCYASSCTGKDPATTTCANDAITVSTDGDLELRYSPSCRAAWARDRNADAGESVSIKNHPGQDNDYSTFTASGGAIWSAMDNDANIQSQATSNGGHKGYHETGWY